MSKGPFARGFLANLLCGLDFHKTEFSFGWMEFLDGSEAPGYAGEFYCSRCGAIVSKGRK